MLSENIKQLRLAKGMTQSQLADSLHVVRQTVSKWEKGSSVPDALMLQKIAEVLDTDVGTLLDCPTQSVPTPPTHPTISKFWLLFTLFWGLFLCLVPTEQDVFDLWETDISIFLAHTALVLSQMRRYLAPSLLGAGVVFTLRSAVRLPVSLPDFLRWGLYFIGIVMAAVGLILCVQFTLIPYIGLNRLQMGNYFWLHDNQWFFALWVTLAAILISLSVKDRPSAPMAQPTPIPPMSKGTAICVAAAWVLGLYILLLSPLHDIVRRYEGFGPITNKTLALLWQARSYLALPLFAACTAGSLLGLLKERLPLPTLPMPRLWRAISIILILCGLYAGLNCTMLNSLPFPWGLGIQLLSNPHWLVLWQSAAGILLHFSYKENTP